MSLINFKKSVDLTGYTLVVPSVSVGNVPQLTIDLLITSLKFENVTTFWHPGLVASVGADPFYSNDKILCTACELYINETFKLAAIQFRSTIETKLVLKFLNDLKECITKLKFKKLYILATGFDYELHNVANKNTLFFITNIEKGENIKCEPSKQLERDHRGKLIVSGSGFAPKLFEMMDTCVDTTLLAKYISEGENIFDAQRFLKELVQCLNIQEDNFKSLVYPASWHYVYGPPPPLGMF